MTYEEFLEKKTFKDIESGFNISIENLDDRLFDFQKQIVQWALRRGRAAIFADTGLGKTLMQAEWARQIEKKTKGLVLILAPLCVSQQTVNEGKKIDVEISYVRKHPDQDKGIFITNYEMIEKFDLTKFQGVVLDESSILKHETSKTRTKLVSMCKRVPYRLSCTATPSPNDYMELGNQSEFLGIMSHVEMLAMFFIHDSGETSKWRLKGHGKKRFWEWLSTWAVCIRNPSDIGFDGKKFILPPLQMHEHIVETQKTFDGELFVKTAQTLSERLQARRETVKERSARCAEIVNKSKGPFLVWCNLNAESEELASLIPDAVEVRGSMDLDDKEQAIWDFTSGKTRVLISKSSISGLGMNWQHCNQMAFVGLNDSFEALYQSIRRCYRFGQKKTVDVHIISADIEGAVLENIKRKESQANEMAQAMVDHMRDFTAKKIRSLKQEKTEYAPKLKMKLPAFLGVGI